MDAKYNMTVEENIFVAKRNIVDYIWKSARLEGINVTFPQTYAIIEKARVTGVDVDDILKITNLKRAWQIVFDNIEAPLTLDLICKIHGEVARDEALKWGELRTGRVYISGTEYIPPIPDKCNVEKELLRLNEIEHPTERAIETMFWGMKSQLFWDGNKRVSMLAANKIMIENGCGIISIPNDQLEKFNDVLCDFYSNNTLSEAKKFVYDSCIDGIDFRTQERYNKEQDKNPQSVESLAAAANKKYEESKKQTLSSVLKTVSQVHTELQDNPILPNKNIKNSDIER